MYMRVCVRVWEWGFVPGMLTRNFPVVPNVPSIIPVSPGNNTNPLSIFPTVKLTLYTSYFLKLTQWGLRQAVLTGSLYSYLWRVGPWAPERLESLSPSWTEFYQWLSSHHATANEGERKTIVGSYSPGLEFPCRVSLKNTPRSIRYVCVLCPLLNIQLQTTLT